MNLQFESGLIKATLLKRYKRFLADVQLNSGEEITIYCPNTGSMKNCWAAGDEIYISKHPNSKRKYAYTWELVVRDGDFILINTHRANAIVKEAIQNGQIDELKNFKIERPEAISNIDDIMVIRVH